MSGEIYLSGVQAQCTRAFNDAHYADLGREVARLLRIIEKLRGNFAFAHQNANCPCKQDMAQSCPMTQTLEFDGAEVG